VIVLPINEDVRLRRDEFGQYPYLEFRLRADLTEAEEVKVSRKWIDEGGLMVGSDWEALTMWLKEQVGAGEGKSYSLTICNGRLQWVEPTIVVVYGQKKGWSDLIVGVAGPNVTSGARCLNEK
jgi:hypothetical protein